MGTPLDNALDYVDQLDLVFGSENDPMPELAERAERFLSGLDVILWEGDAATFQFLYVSDSAERVLGYPAQRWTEELTFWADTVLHPDDRDDAIAYCALCTGKNRDHDFEYRAIAADRRVVWLHDIVRVVRGEKGLAIRLRGIMVDVTARKLAEQEDSPLAAGANIRIDVLERLLGKQLINRSKWAAPKLSGYESHLAQYPRLPADRRSHSA